MLLAHCHGTGGWNLTTAFGESKRQHDLEVLFTTNACVAVCWIFRFPSWPVTLAIAVLMFTTGFQLWQLRSAERAYKQRIKEHLQAGGVVMMVRRGRGWYPVPLHHTSETPLDRP